MLSPTLTDKSHTGRLVGLCSFLYILLIGDTCKILFSQLDFYYYSISNFLIDIIVGFF